MAKIQDMKIAPKKLTLSDGKERTVRFTLNALAELEEKYGSVDKAFEAVESNSIKAIRFILWAGLIHEEPTLTEIEVGNLIDLTYMQEIMDTLGEGLSQDLPEPEKLPEQGEPLPERTDLDPN